jgi:hypothetical protein
MLLNAVGSIRLSHGPIWKNSFTFRRPVALLAKLGPG